MPLENYLQSAAFQALETKPYFDDLQRIGPQKPLAYLPLPTIRFCNRENPFILQKEAINRGLLAIIFDEKDPRVIGGALYIADRQALGQLLDSRKKVLDQSGWPSDPEEFVKRVYIDWTTPSKTDLFDVIADAFGDYTNPNRTDVEDVK